MSRSSKLQLASIVIVAHAACTTYVVLPEGGGGASSSSTSSSTNAGGGSTSGTGGASSATSTSSASSSGGAGASCSDGILNGTETDIDCGGSCAPCNPGKSCSTDADCKADACTGLAKCSCGNFSWAQWPEPRTPRFTLQGPTVFDASTGLTWEAAATYYVTWDQAKAYCANKGAPWRMPTRMELVTIVDLAKAGYEIDNAVFSQSLPPDAKPFWAAEEFVNDTTNAWIVFFSANGTYWGSKNQTFYVRCVH